MPITLEQLNQATVEEATLLLSGLYEHSDWIAQRALSHRPFESIAQLKFAMTRELELAGRQAQLKLIQAHPELAGKAMQTNTLTSESNSEQSRVGLKECTSQELELLQKLNAQYKEKFGWPFILAVRGPRGHGLLKSDILSTFERRCKNPSEFEFQECLRNIHRIVEIRLNDKFGITPQDGEDIWDQLANLAEYSEPEFAEKNQLTVTYLSDAHLACGKKIQSWMEDAGFDEVHIDAVGNVVGRYGPESSQQGRYLLTGSHYDTVRNGGKYDGRLGIVIPIQVVKKLARSKTRLPFGIEVVAFAEEEGQRYPATFLGSGALVGDFCIDWLDQRDAGGLTMREAMIAAGLNPDEIPHIQRDPRHYLGFVEIHIEQGPVLNAHHLPLGVVSSINGSVRYQCQFIGQASHAGTTPMNQRHDAVCAMAELALFLEQRASQDGDSVATMGQVNVPGGSINVVPGACHFSLDLRAPNNPQRDALASDVIGQLQEIGQRRGLDVMFEQTLRASAAPCDPKWQKLWESAVSRTGLPIFKLPSGAGHDAMKLHELMPQAMLFVRGENAGISHNPLESCTTDDIQLAVEAFSHLLQAISIDTP